jgi:hypothetical protein
MYNIPQPSSIHFSPPNLWKSTFEKGGAKTGVPSGGGFPSGPVLVQIRCGEGGLRGFTPVD